MARKVVDIEPPHGPVLISADVHGNWDDYARLAALWDELHEAGRDPVWISVGDWVHGPDDDGRRGVTARDGEELYDYPDRTPEIMAALFARMDAHPARVISLLGNHEHAHIGGLRTSKFHRDEAAALEARMTPAAVADLRARLQCWPMIARVPACGVVITHGALAPLMTSADDLERIRWEGGNEDLQAELVNTGLRRYGFRPGEDVEVLARLAGPGRATYGLLIHGHDREEDGAAPTGSHALLLCTSFGAKRARKAYVLLDPARRYEGTGSLREGHELLRLWS